MPFPVRVSPDVERARAHTLRWAHDFGLVRDDAGLRRLESTRAADLASFFHPRRTGSALETMTDLELWMLLFDDRFDAAVGHSPDLADAVLGDFLRATGLDPARTSGRAPDTALARSWIDLWRRESAGMSPRWAERARRHWLLWFDALVDETRHRALDTHPDVDTYLLLRRRTGAVQAILDANEAVGGFEIPDTIARGSHIRDITHIVCDVVCLVDDVIFLEKEEAYGEKLNMVLVLEHHRGMSRAQAVAEIHRMVDRRIDRYLRLRTRTSAVCAVAGATADARARVNAWVDEAADVMGGLHTWAAPTGRRPTPPTGADRPPRPPRQRGRRLASTGTAPAMEMPWPTTT